jgi:lipoate-protein ligase A
MGRSFVSSVLPGPWRIVFDDAHDVAWNMACDEAILRQVRLGASPPTLRLYQCDTDSISLGRFQSVARTMDRAACTQLRIPLTRRITGGRGILHGDDLIVSVAFRLGGSSVLRSVLSIYEALMPAYAAMFQAVGVDGVMGAPAHDTDRPSKYIGNCFDLVSRADIVERRSGRKLLGSALCCEQDAVLQQASIPLGTLWARPEQRRFAETVFCGTRTLPKDDAGCELAPAALSAALVDAWGRCFEVYCQIGALTDREITDSSLLVRQRYAATCWVQDGRLQDGRQGLNGQGQYRGHEPTDSSLNLGAIDSNHDV